MRMVAENLVDMVGAQPHLVGGRRRSDGAVVFPLPDNADAFDRIKLANEGTLWSYTIQRFCPKEPFLGADDEAHFKPYAVGYVELPDIIVEGRLDVDDFGALKVGQKMRLVVVPFAKDADGTPVATYAFRPVE